MLTQPTATASPSHLSPPRISRLRKHLKQSFIALLAFVVTAGLLNQIIPSPAIPPNVVFVSPKYAYYQAHKADYSALFFGSSRIFNHVVPEVFDSTTHQAGVTVKSFNFGVPALRAISGYVLLRDVLRNPPANLKWVFIETPLDPGYEPIENARTNRSIYWHTFENTRFALDYTLSSDSSALRKAVIVVSHVLPFIYNQINIGRMFHQWIPITQFSSDEQQKAAQFLVRKGYKPIEADESDPKRQAFLNNLEQYQSEVAKLAKARLTDADQGSIPKNHLMLFDKIIAEVEAAGATPIFIVPPTLLPQASLHQAYAQGKIPYLLSFNNPAKAPALYEISQRHDSEHLTDPGAQYFTELLANAFVETLHP